MGNLFTALPATAGNGSGAAVDVSAYGAKKTFTVAQLGGAHVAIEMSNEAVPVHWAPVVALNPANSDVTLDVAARWMRATVGNYDNRANPGAPVVNLAGNDDGATAATLVAPAADGEGAAVNIAALPEFKTFHVAGAFTGVLIIEMSADAGTTWSVALSFSKPGQQSLVFTANRVRIKRSGVDGGDLPVVNVMVTVPGGGGSGGAAAGPSMVNPMALPEQWAQENVAASQTNVALSAQVSTSFDTVKAVRAGSLVGFATRLTEPITAGTLTVELTINGAGTGFLLAHTAGSNPSGGVAAQAVGVDAYVAGDLIGVRITTDAGFLPITTELEVGPVEVVEAV